MPSNHLILCRPLLLLSPIPPSVRVFSNESAPCMRWPEYWSFSFSISPSNEHPGLISFRMDWLDLAVQGTLRSLLQHHSSKASILRCSAFFTTILQYKFKKENVRLKITYGSYSKRVWDEGFPSSCVCREALSHVWLFVTPWTVACQALLSMEFSRQEHWSGLPFPSPGDLLNPGIKPNSPAS